MLLQPSLGIRTSDSRRLRVFSLVLIAVFFSAYAGARGGDLTPLKVIEVKDPDGQILSYRHLAGTTQVQLKGTRVAPSASMRVKVSTRPGFVKLDVNRHDISGLQPANRLGKDFLTYVLWSVSVDGRASNLAEITFRNDEPLSVNVTTTYQTFWLMVTAEPYYAVVEPSPMVVLYSAAQASKEAKKKKAVSVGGDLFYFTHYTTYDAATSTATESTPNELLQARKAIDLASKSGILASDRRRISGPEVEYTRQALSQARDFLSHAEDTYKKDPRNRDVIQFARTAAQTAEDARSLSLDEARDLRVKQADKLETQVAKLQQGAVPDADSEPQPTLTPAAERQPITQEDSDPAPASPPVITRIVRVAKQPALWFALLGWGVAVLLLFRRRAV